MAEPSKQVIDLATLFALYAEKLHGLVVRSSLPQLATTVTLIAMTGRVVLPFVPNHIIGPNARRQLGSFLNQVVGFGTIISISIHSFQKLVDEAIGVFRKKDLPEVLRRWYEGRRGWAQFAPVWVAGGWLYSNSYMDDRVKQVQDLDPTITKDQLNEAYSKTNNRSEFGLVFHQKL